MSVYDGHQDHVRCREYFEHLSELIDGELDDDTCRKIMGHIESCPECCRCWSTFKKSVEIFHHLEAVPAPREFVDRLKRRLSELCSGK
jgi:anti-sigma factor RsiW